MFVKFILSPLYKGVYSNTYQTNAKIFCREFGTIRKPPWREASSIILVSEIPSSQPKACDYNLLMVKRSGLSSFMANAFVFPGGQVDLSDFSPQWWEIFKKFNIDKDKIFNFTNSFQGPRPPSIRDSMTLKYADNGSQNWIPPDIALRIAAIREMFEETGVLLLRNETIQLVSNDSAFKFNASDKKIWQEKINDDANQFINLCISTNSYPDVWSLYEWSNWLTPKSEGPKRFDTMFYICFDSHDADVSLNKEHTIKRWCTPYEMLNPGEDDFFLPPPQVYELSRLLNCDSYDDLKTFAKEREVKGCDHFLPVLKQAADGIIVLLPGDDSYNEALKLESEKSQQSEDSVESLRHLTKNLHRLELQGKKFVSQCNITPANGHFQSDFRRLVSLNYF